MNVRKTVLLTNDDGFQATGIRYLYDELKSEYMVTVVAPDEERSGVGHAFTFNKHIHYEKTNDNDPMQGYIVSGTPADCVKFAVSYLLLQRPDIVISGLNVGENSGLSSFYSGTVAAAREAAFWGIPGFAFSVCKESEKYAADYATLVPVIIREILNTSVKDPRVFYNVNFPSCRISEVKGIRITWQSMAFFDDRYERMEVESHRTREGFMIYGEKKDIEESNAYDSRALMNNLIAITPLSFDSTAHEEIPHLRRLEEIDFTKVNKNE